MLILLAGDHGFRMIAKDIAAAIVFHRSMPRPKRHRRQLRYGKMRKAPSLK
jgi:hypothetical protein